MNLKKLGSMLGVVAAVAMLAMVLQGCGGDDGVKQSLHDQVTSERDAALDAQNQAEAERDAARQAQQEAEDRLEAQQEMEQDAEAAQRASVDATSIRDSAGFMIPAVDLNRDGDTDDVNEAARDVTQVAAGFQGTTVPGALTLTASRVGSTVTFSATDGSEVLIDFEATAGDDGMTSGMTQVDLPGGRTRHVFLMTDIGPPLSRRFAAFAGRSDSGLGTGVPDPTVGSQEYRYPVNALGGTAELDLTNAGDDVNIGEADNIDINAGALQPTLEIPATVVQSGAIFEGSYAGVPGVYICTSATECGFGLDDGDLTVTDGVFAFRPNEDAIGAPDADYLVYGAWLTKPDSAVGSGDSAGLGTGNNLFTQANINALVGEVTYTGTAAGFYAERHVNSEGAVSGTFTATAELTADFDDGATAGSISGTISQFVRDDEAEVDWLVGLDETAIGAAAGGFAAGTTSGSASGANWSGEWGFQLLGNVDNNRPLIPPTGVAGTFGAQHGTPALLATDDSPDAGFVGVVGGFGARR